MLRPSSRARMLLASQERKRPEVAPRGLATSLGDFADFAEGKGAWRFPSGTHLQPNGAPRNIIVWERFPLPPMRFTMKQYRYVLINNAGYSWVVRAGGEPADGQDQSGTVLPQLLSEGW